jgi:hypothetical protein
MRILHPSEDDGGQLSHVRVLAWNVARVADQIVGQFLL